MPSRCLASFRSTRLNGSGTSSRPPELIPANILVDDALRPTAVLDFGFLPTAGDPRFDVAVSAAVFNMYGPHAQRITDQFTARFAEALGCPVEVLLLYRAAYALATSSAFTPDGSDGHFAWCVAILNDPAVTDALGT